MADRGGGGPGDLVLSAIYPILPGNTALHAQAGIQAIRRVPRASLAHCPSFMALAHFVRRTQAFIDETFMTRQRLAAALIALFLFLPAHAEDAARHRQYLQNKNVRIETIVEGAGAPIVLLPSRGRDSEDFDSLAQILAGAGYLVLRPQPRGFGKSEGPTQGITLHSYANDMAYLIRHYGQGQAAIIVGHGDGSRIARMTAADYPDLVRGVVIAAMAAEPTPSALQDDIAASADPRLSDSQRQAHIARAFFARGSDPGAWRKGWDNSVGDNQREAAEHTPRNEWWPSGQAPLLDLQGSEDPFRPPETRQALREAFGERVSVVAIAHASHALIPEQPQAVADAIVAWAKTLPPPQ